MSFNVCIDAYACVTRRQFAVPSLAARTQRSASFGSGSSAENTGQCELSSVEVSMVQSVMQQRNASCSYNMTLESILAVIP